jgi:hypothetical protein
MDNTIKIEFGKSEYGYEFPMYNGQLLSWDISLTLADELEGFPRARTVIAAMRIRRPEQLERERREMVKASFDKLFGHKAKKCLDLIEQELSKPLELEDVC